MKIMSTLISILICHSVAFASITECGKGMLFGADHAFYFSAVNGWVLDNQSGVRQGLHMVFYPLGQTWTDSPVIIYGRSVSKSNSPSIKDQVKETVEEFKTNGSPYYHGERKTSLKLPSGKEFEIYFFSGDQWGNYEAAAYTEETDTINFLVFNARSKDIFDAHIEDFYQIVGTYQNAYQSESASSKDQADRLINEAAEQLNQKGGKEYEKKVIHSAGQQMADFMRDCTSYLSDSELSPFHLFIRINNDGSMADSVTYPTNALSVCFKGLMSEIKHPPHSFDSFLVDIEMRLGP